MTKKHYVKMAEVLRRFGNDNTKLISEICKVLKKDNPRFEKEKFLKACGMGKEEDVSTDFNKGMKVLENAFINGCRRDNAKKVYTKGLGKKREI